MILIFTWLPRWHSGKKKNPPASAGDIGDMGLIPGLERSPEIGNGHSSILARKIPWTEEPGRLQSMGLQESDTTERLSTHTDI